jgi:hypothetical protein
LLRALEVDVGSGVGAESDTGGGCCSEEGEVGWYERGDGLGSVVVVVGECDQAVGDETFGDSRRNLPSWSRKSLLPELLVMMRRQREQQQAKGGWGRYPSPSPFFPSQWRASDTRVSHWMSHREREKERSVRL